MLNFNLILKNVVLLFLVVLVRAESENTNTALLGIDLGFSYITSAYFTEAGPVIASRYETPKLFREMLLATVNGTADQYCSNNSDQDPMSEEIKSILQRSVVESRETRGDAIDIGTLFYPEHLSSERPNQKCWLKIFDALSAVSPHHVSTVNTRNTKHKVYTYPPDDCYDDEYDKEGRYAFYNDVEFSVMVLELINSAFKVSLEDFSFISWPIFSTESAFNVSDVSWPTVNRDELQEQVKIMFQDRNIKDVRGVLFSAEHPTTEADEAAIHDIIETLDRAVPGLAAKVHDFGQGIEFRNAIGAACIAKQLVLYPIDPHEYTMDPDALEYIRHNEL